jgi:hypothetical protein
MEDQSELNAWIGRAIPCLYRPAAFLQLPWQNKKLQMIGLLAAVLHTESWRQRLVHRLESNYFTNLEKRFQVLPSRC